MTRHTPIISQVFATNGALLVTEPILCISGLAAIALSFNNRMIIKQIIEDIDKVSLFCIQGLKIKNITNFFVSFCFFTKHNNFDAVCRYLGD